MIEDIYYQKNTILIRRSKLSDVESLSTRLRKSDVEECWASHNESPWGALSRGLTESTLCLTVLEEGLPVAMFGVVSKSIIAEKAIVWFLSSEKIYCMKSLFIRRAKDFINLFLGMFPLLENYVHTKNTRSIAWLKNIGAKIEEPIKYGIEGEMFHRFTFERK